MEKIDEIFGKLNSNDDVIGLRVDIADFIGEQLHSKRASLGDWEKAHFAQAIACLGWNVDSQHQPTKAWLHLCLVNVEKALAPAESRNESYGRRDERLGLLTYEQLKSAIQALGGRVPSAL